MRSQQRRAGRTRRRPLPRLRRSVLAALLTLTALVLGGCGPVVPGHGSLHLAPNAHLDVVGGTGSPFDTTVQNALADITAYWRANYPKISGGKPLPKLTGGLYSVDGARAVRAGGVGTQARKDACLRRGSPSEAVSSLLDNAFYCPIDDSLVWDRTSTHLLAVLGREYGRLLVAAVFAHEFGHALEKRLGILDRNLPTIDTESQADCAAGAFLGAVLANRAPHFRATPQRMDAVLNGYTLLRDSVPGSSHDVSHGDAFDRLAALQDGITKGPKYCFSHGYFDRKFTERAYVSDQDYLAGGNEPLRQMLDPQLPRKDGSGGGGLQPDLNAYWSRVVAARGKTWTDVTIARAPHPRCEPAGPAEFGYCPGDNTVYYSAGYARQAYYSLHSVRIDHATGVARVVAHQPADFALGTLFAVGWGLAVRHQLGGTVTGPDALRAAICYTGAYAATINTARIRPGHYLALSPPDMDEATSAVLNLVGSPQAFGAASGADTNGLQRVRDFVAGYEGGAASC